MIEVAIERILLASAIRVRHKGAPSVLTDDPAFNGQTIQRFLYGAEAHPQRLAEQLFRRNLIPGRQSARVNQLDDGVSELNMLGETRLRRTCHRPEQGFR